MPNLPKLPLIVFASLATLCLNAAAQQVYESTDEQGNVTFSDTPTPGSRAVTIEKPNLSDAVKVPPPSPDEEPTPAPAPAVTSGEVPPDLSTVEDDDDDDDGDWYLRRNYHSNPHWRREPRGGR